MADSWRSNMATILNIFCMIVLRRTLQIFKLYDFYRIIIHVKNTKSTLLHNADE